MAGQRHILVVDDDADLRAALRRSLLAAGYGVTESATLAEAGRAAMARRFDVILLDPGLPDGDGRDLCAALRRQGVNVPIVLLTGLAGEDELVRGLDAGANDCIVKPFRLAELLARLRAHIRAHDLSEDAELAIGRFRFRPGDRMLIDFDDARTRLTDKEAAVLKYLLRASGVVSRTELIREVWGYADSATTHTVETHIYRLRQKLEVDPRAARLLLNQDGGYRLYPGGLPVARAVERSDAAEA